MASSLLALLDDIATLLDDISVMTKVAAKKTAGVLGDDLALNAQQVSGVTADRELSVVFAVAKGSAINKAILVPAALLISALLPQAIIPLLMIGGAYLCFEGFEKIAHKFLHSAADQHDNKVNLLEAMHNPTIDMRAFENEKIKGAIRTDFILSAEIIVISLGTLPPHAPFIDQVIVLVAIAVIMTIGVYGLVAGIVKLDDAGLYLTKKKGIDTWTKFQRSFGAWIINSAPYLMRSLSVLGTIAMFMVGGGILTHGMHSVHDWIHHIAAQSGMLVGLVPTLINTIVGVVVGAIILLLITASSKIFQQLKP
jgi:predicted DNA repair protein MutK